MTSNGIRVGQVVPVVPFESNIPFPLRKQYGCSNVLSPQTNEIWDDIYGLYKQTPAYDMKNKCTPYLLSNQNSLYNRLYRFRKEPIVVIEQNIHEWINMAFTIVLLILTIVLILYEKKNNLQLVPLDNNNNIYDINCKLSSEEKEIKIKEDKKNIDYYKKIKLTSDIIKGISALYIGFLASVRIFRRTTL
jgi:hypothetical protein